jgi:hypothetical protein
MKADAGQPVSKIEGRATKIRSAFSIDQKLDTILFDNGISGAFFVQGHLILQARASAFGDLDTQAFFGRRGLLLQEGSELLNCAGGNSDHWGLKGTVGPRQVNQPRGVPPAEAPISKHQNPEKFQIPNAELHLSGSAARPFEYWFLVLLWSLEIGIWSLDPLTSDA